MVKSDLIYRILIYRNNLDKFHKIISIYKWEGDDDQIDKVNLSEYTGEFLIYKTQFDIQELKKLAQLKLEYPQKDTKFYREEMGYTTRQLRIIQGYLSELNGEGRNSYYDE
ncbi:hypothetical protein NST54_04585 [Caldifermentibacillus hisashii]|uniref:hypothetical protein n=1 Tax=Caldifermentibacillus hisashii TaxID=996558 RepID=UPI0031012D4F